MINERLVMCLGLGVGLGSGWAGVGVGVGIAVGFFVASLLAVQQQCLFI